MGKNERAMDRLQFVNRPGLVVYVTCGDPDIATTREIILAACRGGADVIEMGVPFSDPVADGPVIQRASRARAEAGNVAGRRVAAGGRSAQGN